MLHATTAKHSVQSVTAGTKHYLCLCGMESLLLYMTISLNVQKHIRNLQFIDEELVQTAIELTPVAAMVRGNREKGHGEK